MPASPQFNLTGGHRDADFQVLSSREEACQNKTRGVLLVSCTANPVGYRISQRDVFYCSGYRRGNDLFQGSEASGLRTPPSCSYESTVFFAVDVTSKPPISEALQTLLFAAEVSPTIVDGFRALGMKSCGLCLPADFREALSEMFGGNKAKGIQDRLEAGKTIQVWSQAKTRSVTQQKVEARAHIRPPT